MTKPYELSPMDPFTMTEEANIECHACGQVRSKVYAVWVYNLCQHFVGLCPDHLRDLGTFIIRLKTPKDQTKIGNVCKKCRNGEFVFRGELEWVHGMPGNRVRCAASDLRDLHYGARQIKERI